MPDPASLRPLLPVAAAMAALLVAGVAAAFHLALARPPPAIPWPARLRRLSVTSPWRATDLAVLLLLIALAQGLRRWLPLPVMGDMLAFHGVTLAGVIWLARRKTRPFGPPLPWTTVILQSLLRWLAILPLLWFASFVWQLMLTAIGHPADLQYAIRLFLDTPAPADRAGFILFAVLLAPLAEEALFRGMLLPLLVRRIGAVPGLLLSSLAFALLHADAGSFAALGLLSVALSLAYARTGSLRVPIAMHMLFNAANLLLLLALSRTGMLQAIP